MTTPDEVTALANRMRATADTIFPSGNEVKNLILEAADALESLSPLAGMVMVPLSLIDKAQAVREELGDKGYGKRLRFKGFVTDKQIALCDALQELEAALSARE